MSELAFGEILHTDSDPLLPQHRVAAIFDVTRMILRERGHALVLPVGELLVTVCTPLEVPQNPEGAPGSWGVELSDWSAYDEKRAVVARTISVSDQLDSHSDAKSFFNLPKYVDLNPQGSLHLPYLSEAVPDESEEEFAGWALLALWRVRSLTVERDGSFDLPERPVPPGYAAQHIGAEGSPV